MWPAVTYETRAWERDPDALRFVSKTRRRKILPSYEAAIPPRIAELPVKLSPELLQRLAAVEVSLARFDQEQAARSYALPALLLRSESSSSSQIERLTSSVRNVALAELSKKAPANALLIAGNVAAMRKALGYREQLSIASIEAIHDVLMKDTHEAEGVRTEQVWIGGTPYSPHGATFVPPHADRVKRCLEDLLVFGVREDVPLLAKAAIFHAQFETIHPFTDGNGRTGRTLVHYLLAADEVLMHTMLPVSAGLLHDVDRYMAALDAYHDGLIAPVIECLADALELAVVIGSRLADTVDDVLDRWASLNNDRAGAASHKLPALLVEQPVVNVAYVATHLNISERAARNVIEAARNRGILSNMGNAKRGAFFQADDLIAVLEEISSRAGIQRIAAR